MTNEAIKLEGCVFPIILPFTKKNDDYQIDYQALEKYCLYLVEQGAKIVMVASATSRFAQLNLEEIKQVNAFVYDIIGNKALVVASTPILGSTKEHVQVAQAAEAKGIRVIACDYPWRYQNDEGMFAYYKTLSDSTNQIQFMLHVTPGRSELGGTYRFDIETLEKILQLKRVIGMKEAAGDKNHSIKIWEAFRGRTSIIVAGMSSQTYFEAFPYGVDGYFVGSGNAIPKVSLDIYDLMKQGDSKTAKHLIDTQELPFLTKAKEMGWHAAIKVVLSLMGLMEKTERPPMVSLNQDQIQTLEQIIKALGWLEKENKQLFCIQ